METRSKALDGGKKEDGGGGGYRLLWVCIEGYL